MVHEMGLQFELGRSPAEGSGERCESNAGVETESTCPSTQPL